MNLLSASRLQLISEAYESKKMIFRLFNLPDEVQFLISTSLTPYLSLVCDGIDNLFKDNENKLSENFEDINGKSFTELLGKTRASSKLLTDMKIGKALGIIDKEIERFNMTLRNGYSESELAYIVENGQPDLGVFYYKDKPFANTIQLSLYIQGFLDICDDVDVMEEVGSAIRDFSMQQSQYIDVLLSEVEGIQFDIILKEDYTMELNELDFRTEDYIFSQEEHRNKFNNVFDKRISLYLFNTQCQLNFSMIILNKLIDNHSLGYRIELSIYYYSVKAFKYILKREEMSLDNSIKEEIEFVVEMQNAIFPGNTLRNNVFHYYLSEDNLKMEMRNDYFISMVEFQTGRRLDEILVEIRNEMQKMVSLIDTIIY